MNQVNLTGRLCADPETRYLADGTCVAQFRLAVDRRVKKGDKTADFFTVVTWKKLAEMVTQYTAKGRLVGVTGRLQERSYTDKEGNKRNLVEVIADSVDFLGGKKEDGQGDTAGMIAEPQQQGSDEELPW